MHKSYIDLAIEVGFVVRLREDVMSRPQIACYENSPNLYREQLDFLHAEQDDLLRKRVSQYPGAYVVFTPEGDADDFVLVGDDPHLLAKEAYLRECEIRLIEPEVPTA